jgi:hypothetical protein
MPAVANPAQTCSERIRRTGSAPFHIRRRPIGGMSASSGRAAVGSSRSYAFHDFCPSSHNSATTATGITVARASRRPGSLKKLSVRK